MRWSKILALIVFAALIGRPAWTAQEAVPLNYFDLTDSDTLDSGVPTCWDQNRTYIYLGSPATFTNCSLAVPISTVDGNSVLNFTTTYTGGWWAVWFNLDWGHSVNYLRYGPNPYLYLRVKWGAIASGANMTITLRDSHDAWNSYADYAGQSHTYTYNQASVNLNTYVTPSTTTWQDVFIPMSAFINNNHNIDLTRISVLILQNATTHYSATNTLYIQKIKVVKDPTFATEYAEMVKTNQLGYLTNGRKLAFVSYVAGTVSPAPTYYQVQDANSGAVVFTGSLVQDIVHVSGDGPWDWSNDTVFDANFTAFTTPGRYVIYCPELGQTSQQFNIGNKVFDRPLRDVLRYFYYARSGSPIAQPYAEGYTRPTIYANNSNCAYDYNNKDPNHMYNYDPCNLGIKTRDVSGGWFDAGDIHLDIHDNVVPMWFLLETYKDFKNKLGPSVLNLPESDGQTNDLVLLIKYQLDWFKKMQNSDGSVHFIVISEFFKPGSTTNIDESRQQVSDVSSGAACILAGIFAKAALLFSNVPGMESYSADLLTRAQLSWSWLTAHPNAYNPDGANGTTWSYGIDNDKSFRSFAAIELYTATGNSTYRSYFETAIGSKSPVTAYGTSGDFTADYYGYLMPMGGIQGIVSGYFDYVDTNLPVSSTIVSKIKSAVNTEAAETLLHDGYSIYNIPMLMANDLSWGTSGYLCGNAYVLLRAYQWTGDVRYRNAAQDVLDHIGGRNPVNRVFITGNNYSDYVHGTDIYSFYWFDLVNTPPGYMCGNINAFGFSGTVHSSTNGDWGGMGMHPLNWYIKGPYKYYMPLQNASLMEPGLPTQAMLAYLLAYFAYDLKLPDTVDFAYLGQFCQAWLSIPTDENWNPNFDLAVPPDSHIDFSDFAVVANNWMNQ